MSLRNQVYGPGSWPGTNINPFDTANNYDDAAKHFEKIDRAWRKAEEERAVAAKVDVLGEIIAKIKKRPPKDMPGVIRLLQRYANKLRKK